MSMESHKSQVLPLKNRVIPADQNTVFLAHYDLNENDVLTGIAPVGNRYVADFNGSSSYLTTGVLPTSNGLTISLWFYPRAGMGARLFWGNGTNKAILTVEDLGTMQWYMQNGSTIAGYITTVQKYVLNAWNHVVLVYNGANVYCYINGVKDANSGVLTGASASGTINFGTNYNRTASFYNGKISEISIWGRGLTDSEVARVMYSKFSGNETDLLAYYKLDSMHGTVYLDSTPQQLHATPVNITISDGGMIATLRSDGYFGGGVAVEESTINLGTSGVGGMNGIGYTYVGDENGYKKYAISGTWNSGTYPYSLNLGNTQYTGGLSYSISCYLYTNAPQKFASSSYGTFGNINIVNDANMTGANRVVRNDNYSAREDYIHSQNWNNTAYIVSQPLANGTVFDPLTDFLYVKDIQVEQKPFATSFVNGNRPPGVLRYPNTLNQTQGTISMWFKPRVLKAVGNGYPMIFRVANNIFEWSVWSTQMVVNGCVLSSLSLAPNQWYFTTYIWNTNKQALYLFDKNGLISSTSNTNNVPSFAGINEMYIGSGDVAGNYPSNAVIDEVRIDRVERTTDEILAWYYSNSPFWPKGIYKVGY